MDPDAAEADRLSNRKPCGAGYRRTPGIRRPARPREPAGSARPTGRPQGPARLQHRPRQGGHWRTRGTSNIGSWYSIDLRYRRQKSTHCEQGARVPGRRFRRTPQSLVTLGGAVTEPAQPGRASASLDEPSKAMTPLQRPTGIHPQCTQAAGTAGRDFHDSGQSSRNQRTHWSRPEGARAPRRVWNNASGNAQRAA